MTDTENVFDGFTLLGDDEEFDVDKIFGSSSDEPAPPPPAPTLAEEVKPQFDPEQVQTETAESQPEPEQTLPAKTQEAPAEEKQPLELFSAFTGAKSDPIPEAAPVKSIAPRPQTQLSLFDKPPVFQYGGAREQITDADMTFEALRIQKADDFPELEDASAVTWQVRYGDVTKTVPAPKTDTIAAMKAEIEKSKAFLDSLKKGKVKDPECVVKPQIRMQKKGIAEYKGVFPTLEAARASNKVICLIPARDGQTYEMRRSELGEFIAPKHKITEFSEVRAGFRPALPRIPQELLRSIIGFFRSQMESGAEFEALVRIYWDRKEQKFIPFVPKQRVTKDRVTVRLTDEDLPDDTRYLYYADIAPHLYRLLYALNRPVRFIICDGDIVEEKNLVRQNFTPADLGENKAKVLAERYSSVFGMETEYVPEFIESGERLLSMLRARTFPTGPYWHSPTVKELVILIGAVDNNKSRKLCHEVFYKLDDLIYIDSGNGMHTGQIVCGIRSGGRTFYRPVGAAFPEVLQDTDKFPTELSCAEASVSAPQSIAANITAATAVVDMIYNILTVGETRVRQITFATCSVNMRATLQKTRRKAA